MADLQVHVPQGLVPDVFDVGDYARFKEAVDDGADPVDAAAEVWPTHVADWRAARAVDAHRPLVDARAVELMGDRPDPRELPPGDGPEAVVAPPPPPRQPRVVELLRADEFAVLDALAEAHSLFMQLPQTDPTERSVWQWHLRTMEDRLLRRAAIRAYPGRFDA